MFFFLQMTYLGHAWYIFTALISFWHWLIIKSGFFLLKKSFRADKCFFPHIADISLIFAHLSFDFNLSIVGSWSNYCKNILHIIQLTKIGICCWVFSNCVYVQSEDVVIEGIEPLKTKRCCPEELFDAFWRPGRTSRDRLSGQETNVFLPPQKHTSSYVKTEFENNFTIFLS